MFASSRFDQAGELLKHVKADNVGLTWDPNNAAEIGEKPWPDGYKKLDPARIFHDTDYWAQGINLGLEFNF